MNTLWQYHFAKLYHKNKQNNPLVHFLMEIMEDRI